MTHSERPGFDSLYSHGFVRVAVAVPRLRVADPKFNAEQTITLIRRAAAEGAALTVFPELGLSSYTADDLFHQDALQDAVHAGLTRIASETAALAGIFGVGAPLRSEGRLFNCAVVFHRGVILGVVPKSYIPSYREFYEKRQFAAARDSRFDTIRVLDTDIPFGNRLLFEATNVEGVVIHFEICEDLWVPTPPSSMAVLGGATLLVNLSASNVVVAKDEYRRLLCASQSARCIAAYLYSAAGQGESTTDLAWDGHGLIYENGDLLAETERYEGAEQLVTGDIDLERLLQDRMRMTSFTDAAGDHRELIATMRRIPFELSLPTEAVALHRRIPRFPYVPSDSAKRDQRCAEVYHIQVVGLATRLDHTGIKKTVIGVSGGLDSTQALIVAAKAMDRLRLPRTNVLGFTMPGFGTSERTRTNAHRLMEALGVTAGEIDIRPSAEMMLKDIEHPAARGEAAYDVTYENVQAGERTSHLFRLANQHQALVVGTGDLSELALGWSTYGVGDQMSHYNVNASVPKTLIQYLISWMIDTGGFGDVAGDVLQSILDTDISPELVPLSADDGEPQTQESEAVVGPFELQDFNLYYLSRFGYRPSRIAYLAGQAWGEKYDPATIKKWLEVFLERFISTSQFKRSALPNAPKVGSGGSLSPRGDWRAPSDASARAWIEELREKIPW